MVRTGVERFNFKLGQGLFGEQVSTGARTSRRQGRRDEMPMNWRIGGAEVVDRGERETWMEIWIPE